MKIESNNKIKVLLLVSGSIAAVKIPLLVSLLIKEDFDVKCVLTKNAEYFVKPLSLSILSRKSCFLDNDQWEEYQPNPLHINLCNYL